MKKILLVITLFVFTSSFSFSQCPQNDETKILLVGDSWAFFMGVDQTINNVMEDWGFPEYNFKTNLTLAENGATTNDFLKPSKQGEIANQLISNPSIKFVHLSIGGNDVLGDWKSQSFTQYQTDSLVQQVEDSLYAVIAFIKSVRPDVQIVYSGYAYPNFGEVINDLPVPSIHPFYGTWNDMEKPTFIEINTILNRFSDDLAAHFANDPRVSFIKATGIVQYTFGQLQPLGVAPGGPYPAFIVPLPEGKPDYPSPKEAMRDYALTKDCFHLSKDGFYDLISYTTQKYYQKALMDDKYIIAQNNQTNGSVDTKGNTSQQLFVGEKNGTNYQTILTFNTYNNLDSIVKEASIFLHRIQHTGGNPINGDVLVTVNNGAFGTNAAIEPVDLNAVGKIDGNPCLYGSNDDGNWVRLDLPQNMVQYITNNEITQFRISAPTITAARVEFSGVDKPDFAPVLNITYGNQATASITKHETSPQVVIYPNPSQDYLNVSLKHGEIKSLQLFGLDGRKVGSTSKKKMDVSTYPSGTYILYISTDNGALHQKVIIK